MKKVLRQWKKSLNPKILPIFLKHLEGGLSIVIKDDIKEKRVSLLGALYFEKIVRKLKAFM